MKVVKEYLVESLGYTESDAEEKIENGEVDLMEESDLYEWIAEVLNLDACPEVVQRYFDYAGFIRDMTYNGELYELKGWPRSQYILLG